LPSAEFDTFIQPQGAFYIYTHIEHLHHDSHNFCLELLDATRLCAMPGTDFDPKHGHHYISFSYAGATEQLKGDLEALHKWRS